MDGEFVFKKVIIKTECGYPNIPRIEHFVLDFRKHKKEYYRYEEVGRKKILKEFQEYPLFENAEMITPYFREIANILSDESTENFIMMDYGITISFKLDNCNLDVYGGIGNEQKAVYRIGQELLDLFFREKIS